jgi:hypothetical protein
VLVSRLVAGQRATVLQLPAQPMTASETASQKRAAYAALVLLAPKPRACARAKLFLGRDVADPTQSDPRSDRPARAGWARLRPIAASGVVSVLGPSASLMATLAPRGSSAFGVPVLVVVIIGVGSDVGWCGGEWSPAGMSTNPASSSSSLSARDDV